MSKLLGDSVGESAAVGADEDDATMEKVDGFDEAAAEPNPLFGRESSENMPTKENRINKRPRRSSKNNSGGGESGGEGGTVGDGPGGKANGCFATCKNNRRRRNLKGNGQPKKGGGGGKGVWGKPGSELDETGVCTDVRDPNYDSDFQEDYQLEAIEPLLTLDQLDVTVKPIIEEYLEHGNTSEVETLLSELNIGPNKHKVAKMAIMLAMDRHNAQREMTSRLISDLYNGIFTQDDIAHCFDELLGSIDDIVLDTPDAHNLLGQFIARCVADDCLAPKFIGSYKGKVNSEFVKAALEKAEVLLSMNHGIAHLDNIWGCGGGNRPVMLLSNKIVELLKEYINSGDLNEAQRCLLELEVPHFHHELVYQACDLAVEDSTERVIDAMVQLLKHLTSCVVLTPDQFEKGMKRMFADINDISVDVPSAGTLLDQITSKLHAVGILSDELLHELQSRGRKRFVSEGDGGKLKPSHKF
jgi:programmed cell death protein 4